MNLYTGDKIRDAAGHTYEVISTGIKRHLLRREDGTERLVGCATINAMWRAGQIEKVAE